MKFREKIIALCREYPAHEMTVEEFETMPARVHDLLWGEFSSFLEHPLEDIIQLTAEAYCEVAIAYWSLRMEGRSFVKPKTFQTLIKSECPSVYNQLLTAGCFRNPWN